MPIIVIIFQGWQMQSRIEHTYMYVIKDQMVLKPVLIGPCCNIVGSCNGQLSWLQPWLRPTWSDQDDNEEEEKNDTPKVIPSRLEIYWWRRWTSALHFSSITLNERLEVEVDREQQVITQPLDFLKILYMVMLPQCYFNKYTIKLVYKQTWGLLEWRQKNCKML